MVPMAGYATTRYTETNGISGGLDRAVRCSKTIHGDTIVPMPAETPSLHKSYQAHPDAWKLLALPMPCKTVRGPKTVRQALGYFYTHPFGAHMAHFQPLRFAGHAVDPATAELGDNFNPITHQELVAKTAALVIAHGLRNGGPLALTKEQTALALFAAGIHDADEVTHRDVWRHCGNTIGDIKHGNKTPKQREQLATVRDFVFKTVFPYLPQPARAIVESVIDKKPNDSPERKLAVDVFTAAHLMVECETGLRAGQACLAADADTTQPLLALYKEVMSNTLEPLGSYGHFTFVQRFVAQAELVRPPR